MRHHPAPQELRTLQLVARHGSFTRAAAALCLTQSAVSRQIAALEGSLGTRLFRRCGNRLALTDEAREFLAAVEPALAAIDEAIGRVRRHGTQARQVNVASAPTFATQWLLPRLERFRRAHPDTELNFVTYTPAFDFSAPGEIDVAIQFGDGRFPHADARYLVGRDVVPICHPKLAGRDAIESARDLLGATRLQHVEVPDAWRDWFEAFGIDAPNAGDGPRFCQYAQIERAVAAGLGVGLVPRCLIDPALAREEIAIALPMVGHARHGHWLCMPREKTRSAATVAFSDWLAEEARAA